MFVALSKVGGVLKDITRYTKKYGKDTQEITFTSGDAIYLGSSLKFNHAFMHLEIASLIDVPLTVSLYNGQEFIEAGRLTDQTNGLMESNYIEFAPKYGEAWSIANTMDIAEIDAVQYLKMYWIKIELSADSVVTFDYIGHKFNDDFDLFGERPELNNIIFLNKFNQTDFEAQAVIAADLIEGELIKRGYAKGLESVLEWENLTRASVVKVAELIYTVFGNTYTDDVLLLRKEYIKRLDTAFPLLDINNTAEKSEGKKISTGSFYR